jgi:hypothetical protein
VIVGGGPSIEGIDLDLIKDFRIIGCNDAYLLGAWVDICFFGDYVWWEEIHRQRLAKFAGLKVTCCPVARQVNMVRDYGERAVRFLNQLRISTGGLAKQSFEIKWYLNTGASAVELAVKLGCKKIILVGFDMKNDVPNWNWHPNPKNNPCHVAKAKSSKEGDQLLDKFHKGFAVLAKNLKKSVPDVEVINANPESGLNEFPKMALEEALR